MTRESGAPEVTSEMIEAGLRVLWESGAIEYPSAADRDLIIRIYRRMIEVETSDKTN
jgi:hypothetical protein